jgi:hypothetical protein
LGFNIRYVSSRRAKGADDAGGGGKGNNDVRLRGRRVPLASNSGLSFESLGMIVPRGFRCTGDIVSSFRNCVFDFLSWRVDDVLRGILEADIVPFVRDAVDAVVMVCES